MDPEKDIIGVDSNGNDLVSTFSFTCYWSVHVIFMLYGGVNVMFAVGYVMDIIKSIFGGLAITLIMVLAIPAILGALAFVGWLFLNVGWWSLLIAGVLIAWLINTVTYYQENY